MKHISIDCIVSSAMMDTLYNNYGDLHQRIINILQRNNLALVGHNHCKYDSITGKFTSTYSLLESHMTFNSFPEQSCVLIDYIGADQELKDAVVDDIISYLGPENVNKQTKVRGNNANTLQNFKCESSFYHIEWKDNQIIEEKMSEYQMITISHNEKIGKTLFLDGVLQVCEADIDNYNIGLSEKMMNHLSLHFKEIDILIVGGGDGFLVEHLLQRYSNINSIVVVELDNDVVMLVNKHFRNNQNIFNEKKVQLHIESGDEYIAKCIKNSQFYHGIIVDCTDYDESSPAMVLFTKDFYNSLNEILLPNGYMTQQFNTIDTLSMNIDGKYQLCYPTLDLFNSYHFEHVNCFSYGAPTYILHVIKKKKVCIYGGGFAGLVLAKLLKSDGHYDVDIYEKSDQLGGRFRLKKIGDDQIFTGAEFVHGEESLLYNFIEEYKLIDELVEVDLEVMADIPLQSTNQITASTNFNELSDKEKVIMVCHELCMNIENIDKECIDIENENWDCGEKNYLMNPKIYNTIMKDLQTYPDNIYYNTPSDGLTDNKSYDWTIHAYAPESFTQLCHSAIKIFFRIDSIQWETSRSILFGKELMNIDVIEIWKNGDYFTVFATAERAERLNNFTLSEKVEYVTRVMTDVCQQKVEVSVVDVQYYPYGYHYPFRKIVPPNCCGEWTSQVFDPSLSSAIKSAHDMYDTIIKNVRA